MRAGFRTTANLLISVGTILLGLLLTAHPVWAGEGAAGGLRYDRLPEAIAVLLTILAMVVSLVIVRRRGRPRLRKLPPVEAIGNAVGRATELGTPIVYITGWGGDMARPTTMASMEILSEVAGRAAEYNCRLVFPSHDPVIASVAEDTIHQAATIVGRPDWAATADVAFVTQSQFGYAAAVDGMMARTHPGAVFLLGTFEGEALLLAESAYQSGAVTIAGTDSTIQLSFFLVACDYTLIGEELFAASGAISGREAATVGVLAQDWLKYVILIVLVVGLVLGLGFDIDLGPIMAP